MSHEEQSIDLVSLLSLYEQPVVEQLKWATSLSSLPLLRSDYLSKSACFETTLEKTHHRDQ